MTTRASKRSHEHIEAGLEADPKLHAAQDPGLQKQSAGGGAAKRICSGSPSIGVRAPLVCTSSAVTPCGGTGIISPPKVISQINADRRMQSLSSSRINAAPSRLDSFPSILCSLRGVTDHLQWADDEIQDLSDRLEARGQEIVRLKDDIESKRCARIQDLEKINTDLRFDAVEKNSVIDHLDKELVALRNELAVAEESLEGAKNEEQRYKNGMLSMSEVNHQLTDRVAELVEASKDMAKKMGNLRASGMAEVNQLKAAIKLKELEAAGLKDKTASAVAELVKVESKLDLKVKEVAALDRVFELRRAEVDKSSREARRAENEAARLRAENALHMQLQPLLDKLARDVMKKLESADRCIVNHLVICKYNAGVRLDNFPKEDPNPEDFAAPRDKEESVQEAADRYRRLRNASKQTICCISYNKLNCLGYAGVEWWKYHDNEAHPWNVPIVMGEKGVVIRVRF